MTKRGLLRWSLILVIFATFAVWLEPTRVVWGRLRGEAFYQGRPTSYWRIEMRRVSASEAFVALEVTPGVLKWAARRETRFPENLLPDGWRIEPEFTYLPFGYPHIDPAAKSVLQELMEDPEPEWQDFVQIWLKKIEGKSDLR
jgi:hypothetical protein